MKAMKLFCAALGAVLMSSLASAATDSSDPVTTMVIVKDKESSRVVELRPFRPVHYLKGALRSLPRMNAEVVQMCLSYPREGKHGYWWPKVAMPFDGATTDVVIDGRVVMRGEPQGRCFCCGLTLETFYRVLQKQDKQPDCLTSDTADLVKGLWFCRKLKSPGPEDAMVALGVGEKISSLDKVLPGDFVQIWRPSGSGHSVVFVAWAYDRSGKRVGMHYWSTQPSTDGIGFAAEVFGNQGAVIDLQNTSFARLKSPKAWHSKTQAAFLEQYAPKPKASDAKTSSGTTQTTSSTAQTSPSAAQKRP